MLFTNIKQLNKLCIMVYNFFSVMVIEWVNSKCVNITLVN